MTKKVHIVTSTEMGWDCIIGVFDYEEVSLEELFIQFPSSSQYVVFTKDVQSDLSDWVEDEDEDEW
jgi:hypothetical protein